MKNVRGIIVRGMLGLLLPGLVGAAPLITTQPQNVEVPAGCPATFAVTAAGTEPLACQSFNTALGR